MRIKFLSVIVSLLFVSFAISSCLDENQTVGEYSTDATIRAFAIDTVLGQSYRFTIDQLKGEIYNIDSLPVGSDTIINKILIDTLTTASGTVILLNNTDGKDSLVNDVLQGLNTTDSVDLRKPMKVKVMSMEAMNLMYQGAPEDQYKKFTRQYTIKVRVHKQDPDTLNWGQAKGEKPAPLMNNFSGGAITGPQKAVILNNTIFVFSKNASQVIAYQTATSNPKGWAPAGTINGLPTTVDLSTILTFNNELYAAAAGEVYSSTNGTSWQKHSALNDRKIASLLVGFPENAGNNLNKTTGIAAVSVDPTDPTILRYCFTNKNATGWTLASDQGEIVPDSFPKTKISATVWTNNTGVQGAMLVGGLTNSRTEAVKHTIPWGSYDGLSWADLYTQNAFCPTLTLPSIFYYGNNFYTFGNGFDAFYTSATGIAWAKANKKFYFPTELTARKGSEYSMVVDSNNFVWIICSKSPTGTDDVWRCRLNRLGFADAITQQSRK
ncbi:DUF6242 domain-containing protein [Bacteroides sp.]|uniref:DUF6242 domain-containing protein n=1 Tax=Bacteroides sp. TaxID=29523 RepID=UPI001B732A74|nr:DUF6242 domain-containing protein [Bacteroides sp.]MBP6065253.1 hypothetical protein [Bacteroides sp.]MBP6066540.1 hypothetical protein [Bacteroides sp.]MBP6935740.1 hypothetical protein [Bacteroides sp.]MBP8621306.1 hypothetical protein [Bacteroides sp.]MBP9507539.1 hypothetical protein [Bacteroides sp.]